MQNNGAVLNVKRGGCTFVDDRGGGGGCDNNGEIASGGIQQLMSPRGDHPGNPRDRTRKATPFKAPVQDHPDGQHRWSHLRKLQEQPRGKGPQSSV